MPVVERMRFGSAYSTSPSAASRSRSASAAGEGSFSRNTLARGCNRDDLAPRTIRFRSPVGSAPGLNLTITSSGTRDFIRLGRELPAAKKRRHAQEKYRCNKPI